MAKVEMTPGMFSQSETVPSWKTPIVLAFFGALVAVSFGFLGKPGNVTYSLSNKGDIFAVPDFVISSMAINIGLGIAMLAIAAVSALFTFQKRKTPLWLTLVAGLIGAFGLLGWLAAGKQVPVSLSSARLSF
jgi:simple sugar transport system permease protein